MDIDLACKYGWDGQFINFTPNCNLPIGKGDVIVQENISLYCVEPNVFIIYDKDKTHYVTGIQLFGTFNKLEA